jgi:pilus assembly protein CpaE
MRAGARDFFPGTVTAEDLRDSIDRVAQQRTTAERNLSVFVNAKGGSGATFLACNVAHMLTVASSMPTALLNLDLQFDSLGQHFDTDLRHGLMDVLESVDQLDAVSLDAYLTQHESGLRLLAAKPEIVVECHADKAGQLGRLLDKLGAQYQHVVVDMPRRIDPYAVPVLEKASRVVLVVQQTLSHLHDAARMMKIFKSYGVSRDQMLAVVNRFDKNSAISAEDISRALKDIDLAVVPSDFRTVAESINLGLPMYQHARGSSVTKALSALETKLGGSSAAASGAGVFGKAISNLLRKESWSRA